MPSDGMRVVPDRPAPFPWRLALPATGPSYRFQGKGGTWMGGGMAEGSGDQEPRGTKARILGGDRLHSNLQPPCELATPAVASIEGRGIRGSARRDCRCSSISQRKRRASQPQVAGPFTLRSDPTLAARARPVRRNHPKVDQLRVRIVFHRFKARERATECAVALRKRVRMARPGGPRTKEAEGAPIGRPASEERAGEPVVATTNVADRRPSRRCSYGGQKIEKSWGSARASVSDGGDAS